MTQREVVLEGGVPWGFRMQGGADVRTPLRVSRVNPGSKAAQRGIREGDLITAINGESTKTLTSNEAHDLLKGSGSTLKLGLNEGAESYSTKRRHYRTVHQETHQETVKRSSVTYVKETIEKDYNQFNGNDLKPNDISVVTNIPVCQKSSSSSSTSTSGTLLADGKTPSSDHAVASRQSSYSNCSSIPDEGLLSEWEEMNDDSGPLSKSKKRRQRRKNLLARHQRPIEITTPTITLQPSTSPNLEVVRLNRIEHKYKVESPKELKLDSSKKRLKAKSKSLDGDDFLKIQELSEASESEEVKNQVNVVISEASSDENLLDDSDTEVVKNLEQTAITPEEEHVLRSFLGGLQLVNSPEESARELYIQTDPKTKKLQKLKQLEEYFSPIVENPRYLDAISEEASSDLSDREQAGEVCKVVSPTADHAEVVYLEDSSDEVSSPSAKDSSNNCDMKPFFDYTKSTNVLTAKEPEKSSKEIKRSSNTEAAVTSGSAKEQNKEEISSSSEIKGANSSVGKETTNNGIAVKTDDGKVEEFETINNTNGDIKTTTEGAKLDQSCDSTDSVFLPKPDIITPTSKNQEKDEKPTLQASSSKVLEQESETHDYENLKWLRNGLTAELIPEKTVSEHSTTPNVVKPNSETGKVDQTITKKTDSTQISDLKIESSTTSIQSSVVSSLGVESQGPTDNVPELPKLISENVALNSNNEDTSYRKFSSVQLDNKPKSSTDNLKVDAPPTNTAKPVNKHEDAVKAFETLFQSSNTDFSSSKVVENTTPILCSVELDKKPKSNGSDNLKVDAPPTKTAELVNKHEDEVKAFETLFQSSSTDFSSSKVVENTSPSIFCKETRTTSGLHMSKTTINGHVDKEEFRKFNLNENTVNGNTEVIKDFEEYVTPAPKEPHKLDDSKLRQVIMTSHVSNKTDSQKLLDFENIRKLNSEIQEKIEKRQLIGPVFKRSKTPSVPKEEELPGKTFVQQRVKEFTSGCESAVKEVESVEKSLVTSRVKDLEPEEGSVLKRFLSLEILDKGSQLVEPTNHFKDDCIKTFEDKQPPPRPKPPERKQPPIPPPPKFDDGQKEPPIPPPRRSKAKLLKNQDVPQSPTTISNVVTPPRVPSADSSESEESSSRCTAKYNPNSSLADVSSLADESTFQPKCLRDLVLQALVNFPFGESVLKELAEVSKRLADKVIGFKGPKEMEQDYLSKVYEAERSKILELHRKFVSRRPEENGSRLLTIIREEHAESEPVSEERLKAKNLGEWLTLARHKSMSTSNLDCTSVPKNSLRRPSTSDKFANGPRRLSLPQEIYEKQLIDIMEKEREIQRELEQLEEEKRKLRAELAPSKHFQVDDFYVSKKGDFAERRERPLSMPAFPTEFFRQQMYQEYMDKFTEREERKQQKVIKISSVGDHQEIVHPIELEQEFMERVKQKLGKRPDWDEKEEVATPDNVDAPPVIVLDRDKVTGVEALPPHLREFVDDLATQLEDCRLSKKLKVSECDKKCCKEARKVYRALAKNRRLKGYSLLHEIDASLTIAKGFLLGKKGVWSPGQLRRPPTPPNKHYQRTDSQTTSQHDPVSPVWTPKSANSSPVAERKEFRPVNFQSPVLGRRTRTKSETILDSEPPWKLPEGSSDTALNLAHTLDRRLPTSQSSPGFGGFSRLPRAQNPTITLLQKAREGQLPRGAQYLDQDRKPPNDRPAIKYPGEVLYQIKNEYTSESESEKPKKMADLAPRKFEGIGPTTKDGMPLILRSEVKNEDQSRWYKRMYDTIHKQKPHKDEYVTIKYKQKRAQYPYTSGYLSEPEPGAYDSDFAEYKYQTLDRRRTPQQYLYFNDTAATMPRSVPDKSYSSSDIAKNSQEKYYNQPGRIENYRPGHSSISEKEARRWWDEVMDIFDGHLEQQNRMPPQKPRSFINQALKESGYESDSTLVFKRKEETAASQLSPKEQREVYKSIQKGGDVPFKGLRKPAPERPRETDLVEFFPITTGLTKIRIHKSLVPPQEYFCYPATVQSNKTFANFKRAAPSSVKVDPPPSPPKRRSSRNNTTLRLISTMKVKRHETCFTSTSVDKTKVNYLKDKITGKLSPGSKKKPSVMKKVTDVKPKPSVTRKVTSTTADKKPRGLSKSGSSGSLSSSRTSTPVKTFGSEKKKFELSLPAVKSKPGGSGGLLSPTEVKKAIRNISKTPAATKPQTKKEPKVGKPKLKKLANGHIKSQCLSKATGAEVAKHLEVQPCSFFTHLFFKDTPTPPLKKSWLQQRTTQLTENVKKPVSVGAMKIYLKHTRPVSDSKFISLDVRSRSASPKSVTFSDNLTTTRSRSLPPKKLISNLSPKSRSPSPVKKYISKSPSPIKKPATPTKLYFSETSRPVSPEVRQKVRSPSSRKIMQLKHQQPLSLYTNPELNHSCTSLDSFRSEDYQVYLKDFFGSEKSEKFKDLNHFYNDIEKVGQLERNFCLKPRKKGEEQIIDYDRWMEVRTREKAEHELKHLYGHLKNHEKEKGFLFLPKDVDKFRWRRELDRGLRIKEKSVENIKEVFERLRNEESELESSRRRDLDLQKDVYKPLWRGTSVANLAHGLWERRSQSEGRDKTHDKFPTRIWSSLSMEQVNNLRKQLQEIYGDDSPVEEEPNVVEVPSKTIKISQLTVRRNSESSKHDLLSEEEKKELSQSISKEVLEQVAKRRKDNKLALPLVVGREVLGAVAAQQKPEKPLIKTDAVSSPPKAHSVSETESASTDDSTKTVINLQDVQKKVEYFEKAKEVDTYVPTVYTAGEESPPESPQKPLPHSQSSQNLKEYFGETELVKFATLPLTSTKKFEYTKKPHLRQLDISPIRTISSLDSPAMSRSASPYFEEAQAVAKKGEVQKLKKQFEFFEDFFGEKLKRSRSENDLKGLGHVDDLRKRYEYPVHSGRGRSRMRRGVSPVVWLRPEDRYMPHINIISKIASLYSSKTKEDTSRSVEELAEILGCPVGEVEKMKEKFDRLREKEEEISLVGRMYTSSPNLKELRDITPYLTANWIAHKFPRSEDNTRSLSTPETSLASRDTSIVRRDKKSPVLRRSKGRFESSRYTKEPDLPPPPPPPKSQGGVRSQEQESPRKYVENEVTIHYKTPIRTEIKDYVSEDELAHRQAEAMKRIYEEEKRRKYLQVSSDEVSSRELQDMKSRRHTDNFTPSQKSPIPLNRYDDFDDLSAPPKPRTRSPEPRLVARALYNFVGQSAKELTFRKGELIYVRRQIDKNWYEGELNAMVGLFPVNYVEIVPYEGNKITIPRKAHEGQARAKYNFIAQTHLELSLAKGELVTVTRRVDDNWYEGKIGGRKGIFPVSYVDILIDPTEPPPPGSSKPVASPAAHSLLLNGSSQGKESMGSHLYTPNIPNPIMQRDKDNGFHHAKPVQLSGAGTYSTLPKPNKSPIDQTLHIETQSEPVPYRALYKYTPQNDDELELLEGDTVYVLEKCDDGWYVGSSDRTGAFGTFPGNYVERI